MDPTEQLQQERLQRAATDLRRHLEARGVDPDMADLQTSKAAVRRRISHAPDGTVQVLGEGTDAPLQLPDGTDPLDHLAKEIAGQVDPKWIRSNADSGSGLSSGPGSGGSAFWNRIRQGVRDREDQRSAAPESAAERLGLGGR